MAKAKKDYFGLDSTVSLILAIIPASAWILGVLTRFKEGNIIAALIRLFGGFNIIWIIDLFMMITKGSIWRLLK